MMLNRSNLFLAALLAGQVVLLAILTLVSGGAEGRRVVPLLEGMSQADIERVMIADDLDKAMTFARGGDGWVLPEADDFPLNGDKVEEILGKLTAMDTRRLVASNPANFARLEVKEDDFRRRIELTDSGQTRILYLGGSGGVDTVYARRGGENDVYLGSGLNSWELSTQVSTWLDASYVDVPADDVLEIRVQNGAGSFTFLRAGEGWTYTGLGEGAVFEDTRMPIILRNAASVQLLEPLGLEAKEAYGLDSAAVTVEVRYRELVEGDSEATDLSDETAVAGDADIEPAIEYAEASYSLSFGAELEAGDFVLKASDAEYYVLVRDTVFNAFDNIRHEDLVKQPAPEEALEVAPASE